jgi:hypothetical protein
MSQTTSLSFSEKMKAYKDRTVVLDSIRGYLLRMEFDDELDMCEEIMQELHQLKEYSIHEA